MPKSEVLSPYPSVPICTYPYTIPGIQTGGTRSGSRLFWIGLFSPQGGGAFLFWGGLMGHWGQLGLVGHG